MTNWDHMRKLYGKNLDHYSEVGAPVKTYCRETHSMTLHICIYLRLYVTVYTPAYGKLVIH